MIATLRHSKAHLSELVARAAEGEEVVITVRGKAKARLCPLAKPAERTAGEREAWQGVLREARAKYSTGTHDSADIMEDIRGDRA